MAKYLHHFFPVFFGLFFHVHGNASVQQDKLNLEDQGTGIENTVNLYMSKGRYEKLKVISGKKVILKNISADVNKESINAKEIKTRGNNSLNFRRKSYSISLTNKAKFFRKPSACQKPLALRVGCTYC